MSKSPDPNQPQPPKSLRTELIDLLVTVPGMESPDGRKALLYYIGFSNLTQTFDLQGAALTFAARLVNAVAGGGKSELSRFLTAMQSWQGTEGERKSQVAALAQAVAGMDEEELRQEFLQVPSQVENVVGQTSADLTATIYRKTRVDNGGPTTQPEHRRRLGRALLAVILVVVIVVGIVIGFLVLQPGSCVEFQEQDGTVVVEAEHYTATAPGREHSNGWPIRSGVGIQWNEVRTGVMQALPDFPDIDNRNTMSETNGPALIYAINFRTPGEYELYIRGFGVNSDGDSVHVGLDGYAITTNKAGGFGLLDEYQNPRWVSRDGSGNPISFTIETAGRYYLYLWMRENGVIIDKVWLDLGKDKVENGDAEPNPNESPCRRKWETWIFGVN